MRGRRNTYLPKRKNSKSTSEKVQANCCSDCKKDTRSWEYIEEYVRDNWNESEFDKNRTNTCICFDRLMTPLTMPEIETFFLKKKIRIEVTDCQNKIKIQFISNGRDAVEFLKKRNEAEILLVEEHNRLQEIEEEKERRKEKERIARFGSHEQQIYRTKFDLTKIFPTIIHCREHILKNSLSGMVTDSLEQRMKLKFDDLENLIDGSIEVRLLETKTESEEWVSFNKNWRHLYPFNKIRNQTHIPCNNGLECKGHCSDNKGNRVYVLQFKDENSIYSGGTNKCLYWRYHQHSTCVRSNNCEKLKYRHNPIKGLRWDLMHKFYSDEYVFTCDYKVIENWLNINLKSCEYDDHGDGGKHFNFGGQ